jgi:hypothetical protein
MDPQNRVHMGLSLTDGVLAPGLILGLDSRMTRLVYVDVGGFGTLADPPDIDVENVEPPEYITLRHGLTVTPGLRVPHRYGDGINWDLTFRGGFGAVWATDASAENSVQVDPALLTGADLLIRKESLGLRTTGRIFGFKPFTKKEREEIPMARPQYTIELVYQW